jgi:uncharacterized protein (TIGR02145 family)
VKILKYILIAIVLLGSEQNILSQYYLKVKANTTSLESDSVLIFVNGYRGTINWQVSSDLVNWISLNKHNDTLGVRIDSSAYYRATIFEENCNPVMSDTAFIIEKLTVTGSNQFTVDSLGGVFLLPSGIKVKIPKGAVINPKVVRLDTINSDSVNVLAGINIVKNNSFLSGISLATDTFNFRKPIKIKIPIQHIGDKSLPALYEFNNESKTWLFSDGTIIVSPKDKFVEIILEKTDNKGTLTKGGPGLSLNDIRSFFLKLWGNIFWSGDPCRKVDGFRVETRHIDYATGEGCTGVQVQEDIAFYGCTPTQTDAYVARVLSPECEPQFKYSPGGKIKRNESVSIKLTTEIGGFPLSDQEIQLNTSGNLSIKKPVIFTNDVGNVSFDVTGIEPGYGTVYVSVSFDYYLFTSFVEHNGVKEYYEPPEDHRTIKQDYGINVTVYDVPEVTTASVTDIKCTSAFVGGNVIKDNYDPVTEYGVIVNGVKHPIGTGLGTFGTNLTVLECNKEYTVRAYAINEAGIGYGNTISFNTLKLGECLGVTSTIIDETCICTAFTVKTDVISDVNEPVIESGVYHGRYPNPELTGAKVPLRNGTGTFSARFGGTKPITNYYVKAYATTECGTIYGNQVNFKAGIDSIADIDGNFYETVKIGTQIWMSENLKTTRLNDGTLIPNVTEGIAWHEEYGITTPAYCWYNNDAFTYKETYGALYNWYAINTGNLCPTGWHVPLRDEWETLINYLGGDRVAGGKLKATGTIEGGNGLWQTPNTGATDEVCFKGLPGGYRYYYDNLQGGVLDFANIGQYGQWWCDDHYFPGWLSFTASYADSMINWYGVYVDAGKSIGQSVRCLKNSAGTKGLNGGDTSLSNVNSVTIIQMKDK